MEISLNSFISALIGGSLAVLASYLSHKWNRDKEKENEVKLIANLVRSIHDEIDTLWNQYNNKIGSQIELLEPNQPFNFYWAISQDYFTIYTRNAHLISKIDDGTLRRQIVSTYSRSRGLIDSYQLNNNLVHKYEQAYLLFQQTNNPIHKHQADSKLQILTSYADSLKQTHFEVKESVELLLSTINKKIKN